MDYTRNANKPSVLLCGGGLTSLPYSVRVDKPKASSSPEEKAREASDAIIKLLERNLTSPVAPGIGKNTK